MSVVDLDRDKARELVEAAPLPLQPRKNVLQRGADEEIFLLEAQLASRGRTVVRVEHAGQAFPMALVIDGAEMVAFIEPAKIELARCARRPQPEGIHDLRAEAGYWHIECRRLHLDKIEPAVTGNAVLVGLADDPAIKADWIGEVSPWKLPGGAKAQPSLRLFMLRATSERLRDQAKLIPIAVAIGRNARRRRALEQAGGKPAQSTVAQGNIDLLFSEGLGADAGLCQALAT